MYHPLSLSRLTWPVQSCRLRSFGKYLILYALLLGLFTLLPTYSSDDYYCRVNLYYTAHDVLFMNYRVVFAALLYLINIVHINVVSHTLLFGIIQLLVFALCSSEIEQCLLTLMPRSVQENRLSRFLVSLSSFLFWGNVFVSEWMWFRMAYPQWFLSVLASTYAATWVVLRPHSPRKVICSILLLFVMMGSYQGAAAEYVYLVLLYSFLKNAGRIRRAVWCDLGLGALFLVVATIIDLAVVKIISLLIDDTTVPRTSFSLSNLGTAVQEIVKAQKDIWVSGLGITPKYFLVIFWVLFLLCLVVVMVRAKAAPDTWLFVIVTLLSGMVVVYLIQMTLASIWLSIRVCVPLLCALPCILVLFVFFSDKSSFSLSALAALFTLVYAVSTVFLVNTQALDCQDATLLDGSYFFRVQGYIEDYERATQTQVTQIGFCQDGAVTYRYPIKTWFVPHSEMGIKSSLVAWADIHALNYWTNSNYEKVAVPEDIQKAFASQDWDHECLDEQILFDGQTAYLCAY